MKKKLRQDNRKKADAIKSAKAKEYIDPPVLKTKYYGGFQSEFLDDDKTTAYNS